MPAHSPELEVSQGGQTGRVSVQDRRLKVLPHPRCRHFLVAFALAHIILKAPRPQGAGGTCPSPPHWALRTWQVLITSISGCRAQR